MRVSLDQLQLPSLTLIGVCRGGVETCLMVPELAVMFDVGMCPPGSLKYKTILVSHGHADHLGGLHYLVSQRQLFSLAVPRVHVPSEIEADLRQIFSCWSRIEGFELKVEWQGHSAGSQVSINPHYQARALKSRHRVPSLAWLIERRDNKLLPEFAHLPGDTLAQLRRAGQVITEPRLTSVLGVTGDTTIDCFDQEAALRSCQVLVHEVTSWDDRRDVATIRQWGHTHIDEMIERSERFEGETLVLVHRSPRHSRKEAEQIVARRFPASVRDKVVVFGN